MTPTNQIEHPTWYHIGERDKAIVDLYDAFRAYMKAVAPSFASDNAFAHPILVKYQEFVQEQKKVQDNR